MRRFFAIVFTIVGLGVGSVCGPVANLASFDEHMMHYGIQIGYSQSKFDFYYTEDGDVREALQGTTSYYNAGFHIAIIGDMKLCNFINFRMLPGLTIINRSLNFSWEDVYAEAHPGVDAKRSVESVYGEIPVEFKFRAKRYNDFRPYLTAGASWGFDFASLRKNLNNNEESIIRLNPVDLRYTAGVGFDVFLRYVKFAIELKMAFGMIDLRVADDDYYTLSTTDFKSRTFMLSFTFEG